MPGIVLGVLLSLLYRGRTPHWAVKYLPDCGSQDVTEGSLAPERASSLTPPVPEVTERETIGGHLEAC